MIVMMNLASDFDELVTGQLQKNGFVTSAAHNPYLRFATLYARTERSVPQIKYSMLVSTELQGNPQFQLLQPVINEIAATLAEGGAVLPYLSRMASDPNSQRDGLLAYWGIHHLHLSSISTIDAKGHVTRADYLLFVRFEGGIAHFIDILPHANRNAFVDTALIEIVDKNW
ncbi:MAG TPA: hypothetical protein VK751_17825, partial [Undibacterium sp.]|nr:hypothetical protein [Undibacterium sp.]